MKKICLPKKKLILKKKPVLKVKIKKMPRVPARKVKYTA